MAKGKTVTRPGRDYATIADFCGLFKAEANRFYYLCRLLVGDTRAEQCFVSSLENCLLSHRVFREWAQRWAVHTIVKTAIQMNQSDGAPKVPVQSGSAAVQRNADPGAHRSTYPTPRMVCSSLGSPSASSFWRK